jgi:hypothetical protein
VQNLLKRILPNLFLPATIFILLDPTLIMNKRYVVVGIILGSIVTIAFFVGSPMFGGFDIFR